MKLLFLLVLFVVSCICLPTDQEKTSVSSVAEAIKIELDESERYPADEIKIDPTHQETVDMTPLNEPMKIEENEINLNNEIKTEHSTVGKVTQFVVDNIQKAVSKVNGIFTEKVDETLSENEKSVQTSSSFTLPSFFQKSLPENVQPDETNDSIPENDKAGQTAKEEGKLIDSFKKITSSSSFQILGVVTALCVTGLIGFKTLAKRK